MSLIQTINEGLDPLADADVINFILPKPVEFNIAGDPYVLELVDFSDITGNAVNTIDGYRVFEGNSASATLYGRISAGCSDVTLNVNPLYQCLEWWSSDPYDHLPGVNICGKGCALTSLAMISSFYGYITNPHELNIWLTAYFNDKNSNGRFDLSEQPYGYTRNGSVIWPAIAAFTMGNVNFKGASSFSRSALDAELCQERPVILNEPGHFIVANGKESLDDESTYMIRDPGHRDKTSLASYQNSALGMRKFGPPGSGNIYISADDAVHLLITDPGGQREGYLSGFFAHEILKGFYSDERIDDLNGATPSVSERILEIHSPMEGVYKLTVTGVRAGPSVVEIYRYARNEAPQELISFNTNLKPGEQVNYTFNYSGLAGDVNGDGKVDAKDLEIVKASDRATFFL